MAVSPHPSVKPSPPRKPPSDRGGQGSRESGEGVAYGAKHEFGGYSHSSEHSPNHYGHNKRLKHGSGGSEFDGAKGFPKAGD